MIVMIEMIEMIVMIVMINFVKMNVKENCKNVQLFTNTSSDDVSQYGVLRSLKSDSAMKLMRASNSFLLLTPFGTRPTNDNAAIQ